MILRAGMCGMSTAPLPSGAPLGSGTPLGSGAVDMLVRAPPTPVGQGRGAVAGVGRRGAVVGASPADPRGRGPQVELIAIVMLCTTAT